MQIEINTREIKIDNFYQKALKKKCSHGALSLSSLVSIIVMLQILNERLEVLLFDVYRQLARHGWFSTLKQKRYTTYSLVSN